MAITLNIALTLPPDVRDGLIKESRKIGEKLDAYFVLDGETTHPHITVYATAFPEAQVENIIAEVERTPVRRDLYCHPTGIESDRGYISLGLYRSVALAMVHERVVQKLSVLRERVEATHADEWMTFTDVQRENLKEYGYAYVLDLYRPHITIIRLKNERAAVDLVRKASSFWGFSLWRRAFSPVALAVYRQGDHGTCTELLREFPIQK